MNGEGYQDITVRDGDATQTVRVFPQAGGSRIVDAGEGRVPARLTRGEVQYGPARRRAVLVRDGGTVTVVLDGVNWPLDVVDPLQPPAAAQSGGDSVMAPMPGRIIAVRVAVGDQVARGDVLLVLEAMKVQMRLTAPRDGTVAAVRAREGDLVDDGAELVSYDPA